ncbi:recombinase family protein [Beijerinckia sp. L45]|uniref:recombinase family protein n=1 Tax=Beijerinckia sp. L45 TaxID=1641855 RepID=UPI001FEE2A4A|nr:recombinase family protein [Beijerinckia sp. L45]
MRAAIYARFSTDLQNERSVEDQIALCQDYAAREHMRVVKVYFDKAKSGASIIGRDGLLSLIADAKTAAFDAVLVEHTDRLSRDMEDLSGLHKRFGFAGIEIRAIHSGGAVDTAMIGLFGLVGQMQREDGAKKVRRGMAGVVRGGRHAGGRAYGYRPIPGRKGELEIVPQEQEIVQRIFTSYAAGSPPRVIAGELNAENIAPPRGERWNASTINGNAARGNGIIFNEIYTGKIVWNKVRMVKDPDTGRRISRVNEAAVRQTVEAPHLRIVDQALWDEVQTIKAGKAKMTSAMKRRPAHLLSGLLRCGSCGAGMSVHDRDAVGRARIRCSAVSESGTCAATRRLPLARIEAAVLDGMREQLRDPALIEEYVRTYNEERLRLANTTGRDRARLQSRLETAQRELDRAVQNLIKGRLSEDEADQVLPTLRGTRDVLREELATIEAPPKIIALHPVTMTSYLRTIDKLSESLAAHAGAEDDRGTLTADLRALVDHVVVTAPVGVKDIMVEVKGRLAALIGGTPYPEKVGVRLVAEEGLEPPTRGL